jgi:ACS family sodium-dependent inorganic phosphate cotransporter
LNYTYLWSDPIFFFKLFSIQQTLGQWQIIFYTTAAVYIVEFIVYGMLASGEEQPWNRAFQQKGSDDAHKKLEGSTQEIE